MLPLPECRDPSISSMGGETTPTKVAPRGERVSPLAMKDDPQSVPAEELVGKDELDEDDEMVLSADDLVEETPDTGA